MSIRHSEEYHYRWWLLPPVILINCIGGYSAWKWLGVIIVLMAWFCALLWTVGRTEAIRKDRW